MDSRVGFPSAEGKHYKEAIYCMGNAFESKNLRRSLRSGHLCTPEYVASVAV